MTLEDRIQICEARSGTRCKDCILYGPVCEKTKHKHHVDKLLEIDLSKLREVSRYDNKDGRHDERH